MFVAAQCARRLHRLGYWRSAIYLGSLTVQCGSGLQVTSRLSVQRNFSCRAQSVLSTSGRGHLDSAGSGQKQHQESKRSNHLRAISSTVDEWSRRLIRRSLIPGLIRTPPAAGFFAASRSQASIPTYVPFLSTAAVGNSRRGDLEYSDYKKKYYWTRPVLQHRQVLSRSLPPKHRLSIGICICMHWK